MKRKADAQWNGDLKSGSGHMTTTSKVLDSAQYSFHTRFEEGNGTNPEELIAAAHAGCFSMALSHELDQAGLKPERVHTEATVQLDQVEGGFEISAVHLEVTANVPGADEAKFNEIAEGAKKNCPVSKVLNADITMDVTLHA